MTTSATEAEGRLQIEPRQLVAGAEIVHHYDSADGDIIQSRGRHFTVRCAGESHAFSVPLRLWKRPSLMLRAARRFLRTDKSHAVFNHQRDGVVIIYDGNIFLYEIATRQLRKSGQLRQSRTTLHGGIAVTRHGIFFGEYGHNAERREVPIWRSSDGGRTWTVPYVFPAGAIKHVHGVYMDPYSDRLWITSGDFDGECQLVEADVNFEKIQVHGDRSQRWRPVSLFFTPSEVIWVMDSPLETSRLQVFKRDTGKLEAGQAFPGPVWYTKQLIGGTALLQTTVEIGPGVQSDHAMIFASDDLHEWQPVLKLKKDRWPMPWFKFGTIAFPDGSQTTEDFIYHGEALSELDGVARHGRLVVQ